MSGAPASTADDRSGETWLVRRSSEDPIAARQRGELPVFDPVEAERALGFVRLVRLLVALPMTSLGVLAFGAGLAMGNPWFAVAAAVMTALIPLSLRDDTRLAKALERFGRGDLTGAEQGLLPVARRRQGAQAQRACAYLAAIAWRRCDHEAALQWVRARQRLLGRPASVEAATDVERWTTAVTEVWLLALLGHADEANQALARLGPARDDGEAQLLVVTARLLVAFARDQADDVRPDLVQWQRVCEAHDRTGLASVALVWALQACGRRDAAKLWAERIRAAADGAAGVLEHVEAHAPRLHRWFQTFLADSSYARS